MTARPRAGGDAIAIERQDIKVSAKEVGSTTSPAEPPGQAAATAQPSPARFYTYDQYREVVEHWGQAVADELIDLLPPWYRAHFEGDRARKAEAAALFWARWQELQPVQEQPEPAGGAGATRVVTL